MEVHVAFSNQPYLILIFSDMSATQSEAIFAPLYPPTCNEHGVPGAYQVQVVRPGANELSGIRIDFVVHEWKVRVPSML